MVFSMLCIEGDLDLFLVGVFLGFFKGFRAVLGSFLIHPSLKCLKSLAHLSLFGFFFFLHFSFLNSFFIFYIYARLKSICIRRGREYVVFYEKNTCSFHCLRRIHVQFYGCFPSIQMIFAVNLVD